MINYKRRKRAGYAAVYSLLVKNGHLFDPDSGLSQRGDVALNGRRIAEVGNVEACDAEATIDAEGCMVMPGLVDMHAHLYPLLPNGISAEAVCFSTGVITAVDAGSSGCASYPYFRPFIHTSQLRIKAFLNVSTAGICAHPAHEDVDPAKFDAERIRDVFAACPETPWTQTPHQPRYSRRLRSCSARTHFGDSRQYRRPDHAAPY